MTEPDENGCLIWLGARFVSRNGKLYGHFAIRGRTVRVHRYAYGVLHGRIPDGFDVHHTCRNTLCVNPEHLEALSTLSHGREHNIHLRVTHCPSGHPYDERNTYRAHGRRYCRQCQRQRNKPVGAPTAAIGDKR